MKSKLITNKFSIIFSLFISIFSCFYSSLSFAAEGVAAAAPSSPFGSGLVMVVILVAMYFLMIRPQSKRAKQQREMISKVAEGDEILTSGGIVGKIQKISGNFIILELNASTTITIQRNAIGQVLPKGTIKSI